MLIVLVPGLMNDAWVWSGQIPALSRIAPVTVACNDGLDDLGAMAERILAATSGPLAVIGHSMGGRVALEAYAQAPDRVYALGLLSTGAHGRRPTEVAGRERLVEIAFRDGMAAVHAAWTPDMLAAANRNDPALNAGILAMLERATPEIFQRQQAALLGRKDRTDLLGQIACPTLVATGAEDSWASPAQHEEIARPIRGARLAIIEGAGHMAPVESPEAVARLLTDFLRAL